MKKAINKVHHSTSVVQAKHAISVKKALVLGSKQTGSKNVVWLEMNSDSEIKHLRQVLLTSYIKPPVPLQRKPVSSNQSQSKAVKKNEMLDNPVLDNPVLDNPVLEMLDNPVLEMLDNPVLEMLDNSKKSAIFMPVSGKQNFTTKSSSKQSVSQRVAAIFSPSPKVKSKSLVTFDNLVNSALHASTSSEVMAHHPGEILNIITLLDTGGQPEYIHLLPTVNIHPMVNFVVHDLSKNLEDQVLVEYSEHGKHIFEPYHLRYSNFDMIKFLMSATNDAIERPLCQVPQLVTIPGKNTKSYICCVGTHADKVTPEIIYNTDNKLTAMVEKLGCKAAVWQNENDGVLFSVDNTTAGDDGKEDPLAEFVRSKIETLASEKDVYELPITWMMLEMEIRQVCSRNNKAYISFQDCVSVAFHSNLITDVEQVRSVLQYHHLLGVLLYYPEVEGLCDYVIVDHQWLFDRLTSIVRFALKQSSDLNATKRLKYDGILSKELLEDLKWEEELKQKHFISLLVEMKIIAPIKKEDGNEQDFFIPYVLPTYISKSEGDELISQYGCLQGEPLLIQFISNLLPRGFFCCLVVQLLQQLPHGWNHVLAQKDVHHAYSNLITFCLPSAYFLSLLDKLSYLEVQIRHQKAVYYQQCPVHLSVQDILSSALATVCEQLSYNNGRICYGFHCQCGEMGEEHIAAITRLTPPFDYALCKYGSIVTTALKHSHIVWLTEVNTCVVLFTQLHHL